MKRRFFLKQAGILALGSRLKGCGPMAGPFTADEFSGSAAPHDKRLNQAWVSSLYERGKVTTYLKSRNELRYIGMPVGGICCGTVYVGGDGRLWVWDIFNQNQLGVVKKVLPIELSVFNVKEINNSFGTLYLEPAAAVSPIQQGFALAIKRQGTVIIKRLHQDDWDEVSFEATYPVATIRYTTAGFPLEVTLQAFSPFIPGDAEDSGLPLTVQSFSIKNTSGDDIEVEVIGWLENRMLMFSEQKGRKISRTNHVVKNNQYKGVFLTCKAVDKPTMRAPDFGNMAVGTFDKAARTVGDISKSDHPSFRAVRKYLTAVKGSPVAGISLALQLKPAAETTADFFISWYVPNISFPNSGPNQSMTVEGADFHYYSARFKNAADVIGYVATNYASLKQRTLLWKDTWYDSTLPWWFLERTFMNISTLATTTSHRFKSGRFYAWEGVGCCHGTCTHVYQYAQAMSRIFPELERDTRQRVDLGIGYDEATGMIRIRGEKTGPSIDGQAGTVLRIYREYLMSEDGLLLRKNWSKIRKAVEFIMKQDKNKDGMLDTPMENTLDALWSGEISWLVGLCIAGVRAGEVMAEEMDDPEFARVCKSFVEQGRANMESHLFNGEYFIHRPDPAEGKKGVGSYNTCHIDQVYGQSWAWQAALGRILSKEKTMSALRSLWKYNFMPDVGPYIKDHTGGRFYALAGDGGMVMNTNPSNEPKPYGEAKAWQIGYFSECMTGFEHQVASHMLAEGMVDEALVLTRSIHDRYHAGKRNPFNEIECSDHYARAMASYGTFLMACGFQYHGPKGHIRFAPAWNAHDFRGPFTAAAGWGTYSQKHSGSSQEHVILVKQGSLRLQSCNFVKASEGRATSVTARLGDEKPGLTFTQDEKELLIRFETGIVIKKDEQLVIVVE